MGWKKSLDEIAKKKRTEKRNSCCFSDKYLCQLPEQTLIIRSNDRTI